MLSEHQLSAIDSRQYLGMVPRPIGWDIATYAGSIGSYVRRHESLLNKLTFKHEDKTLIVLNHGKSQGKLRYGCLIDQTPLSRVKP